MARGHETPISTVPFFIWGLREMTRNLRLIALAYNAQQSDAQQTVVANYVGITTWKGRHIMSVFPQKIGGFR